MTDFSIILILILIISLFASFLYIFLSKKIKKNVIASDILLKDNIDEKENRIKMFSDVLQQIGDGIAIMDRNKNLVFVNRSFRKNIRSGPSDNVKKFELLTRNYELNNMINETIEKNEVQVIEKNITYFDRASEKIAYCKVFKIEGTKNYAAIVRDITYLQKTEKVRATFIQNLSHEIKTPITAIMGFIETLKNGALENRETAVKFFNIIEHHAKRLNSLIDDLLILTNIETGKTSLKIERFNLQTIIDSSVFLFQKEIRSKKLEIIQDIKNASILSDFSKISQIVTNLLQNAVKYTENNGIIKIEASIINIGEVEKILSKIDETAVFWDTIPPEKDTFLFLSMEDTGSGVSYVNLLRLGERFFRVDSSHSHDPGGTGLGLAIVKHTLKILNGVAILQSCLGSGFSFIAFIPAEMENQNIKDIKV